MQLSTRLDGAFLVLVLGRLFCEGRTVNTYGAVQVLVNSLLQLGAVRLRLVSLGLGLGTVLAANFLMSADLLLLLPFLRLDLAGAQALDLGLAWDLFRLPLLAACPGSFGRSCGASWCLMILGSDV